MASSKDRERELARRRYQRQLERRAANQAKARQRVMIGSVVVAVLAIVGAVVGIQYATDHKSSTTDAAGATPSASAAATGAAATSAAAATTAAAAPSTNASPTVAGGALLKCTTPPAKPAKAQSYSKEPALTVDTKATYTLTMTTNCGVIKADLYAAKAPHTVNSFLFLASKGYFTNTPCHRLTTSGIYVLQCGDPTGTGSGTPGYSFKDENLTGATYGAGVLAMANSGANTNGSQFFINYKDSQLAASYTPFGKITQGLDIVAAIGARGAAGGTGDGAPTQPVSILSFTITKGGPAPAASSTSAAATSAAAAPTSAAASSQ